MENSIKIVFKDKSISKLPQFWLNASHVDIIMEV